MLAGVALGGWWVLASLLVSWWVYDLSSLYRWGWLPGWLGPAPATALNLHSGFDETSRPLRALLPATAWTTADFYAALPAREPSIERARRRYPPPVPADAVLPAALPYASSQFAAVLLLFAAHEIRDAATRDAFFAELRRVLRPGGQLLLVEHVRDAANVLAFGPGAWHFWPAAEWERLAAGAGLQVQRRARFTPFVRAWLLSAA